MVVWSSPSVAMPPQGDLGDLLIIVGTEDENRALLDALSTFAAS